MDKLELFYKNHKNTSRLMFHTPKNEILLKEWLNKASLENINLLGNILSPLLNKYYIKVVTGSNNPGFHISIDNVDWKVIAWIDSKLKFLNLRLLKGTNVAEFKSLVSNFDMQGTPHPIVVKIDNINQVDIVIKLVNKALLKSN